MWNQAAKYAAHFLLLTIFVAYRITIQPIYKVFSHEKLTDRQIAELFAKPSEVERVAWRAYPVLEPSQQWPSFRLGRRLYYTNAMESAVSTMETEAVAARNVVGLLKLELIE